MNISGIYKKYINLFIFLKYRNVPPESDGFTAVILTYDRVDSLFNVIKKISVSKFPSSCTFQNQ